MTRLKMGLGLFIVYASAAAVAWQWNRGSLPLLPGELQVAGLDRGVDVLLDGFGVPHIKAASLIDRFFARGFVAARDRMLQMELNRRAAPWCLCETAGQKLLLLDTLARNLQARGKRCLISVLG